MSSSVQQQFVSQYYPYALQASQVTGVPASYILGQAALESNWGQSNVAQSYNNFFGINVPGGDGTQYQTYASPAESFASYAQLIAGSPRYSQALQVGQAGGTAGDYASALQAAGYATNPAYGSSVAGTTAQVQSILGESGAGIDPGQFGIGGGLPSGAGWGSSPGLGGAVPGVTIPGVAKAIASPATGWVGEIISAGEGAVSGFLTSTENWFVRAMLIGLAVGIILLALYKAMGSPDLTKAAAAVAV